MHWAAPNCVPMWGQTELQKGMCAEQVFPVPTLSLKWKCQCFRSCVGVWAAAALCQSQVQLRQSSHLLDPEGLPNSQLSGLLKSCLKIPHTIFTNNPSGRMEAFFADSKSLFCPFCFPSFPFWAGNVSVFLSWTSILQHLTLNWHYSLLVQSTRPLHEHR